MDGFTLALRLMLALVFLIAAAAKLRDRDGSRAAVGAFGVPEGVAGAIALALPLAELTATVLLVPAATARAGAGLAAALLVVFCAAIARSMARGEAPDCHCFGALHSAPAGPRTLARNAFLSAAAVVVVAAGPGTSATAWIGRLSGTAAVLAGAGLAVAVVMAGASALALVLLRRHGELLLRIDALEDALAAHGIELAPPAPQFELPDLDGNVVSLESLRDGMREVLLVFTDPGCGPCSALMPEVAAWQRDHPAALRVALVSRGGTDANLAHASEHGVLDVLVQEDREVNQRFGVSGTPSAVLLSADGRIASGVHAGADAIRALVASRVGAPSLTPALSVIHH
jgi:methylamine dehydrogenase accessory protein MauD